jgi:hypothetical protein
MTTRTDQEVGALGTKSQAIRRGGDTRSRSAFGELPSGTTTGLLERNLFESILDAPSLILIEAGYNPILRSFPPSGPDDISHSLHLQSFVKDKEEWPDADTDEDEDDDRADDTLVRCWMAADSSLFRLQPHEFARELPLLQIAAEVSSSQMDPIDTPITFAQDTCRTASRYPLGTDFRDALRTPNGSSSPIIVTDLYHSS